MCAGQDYDPKIDGCCDACRQAEKHRSAAIRSYAVTSSVTTKSLTSSELQKNSVIA